MSVIKLDLQHFFGDVRKNSIFYLSDQLKTVSDALDEISSCFNLYTAGEISVALFYDTYYIPPSSPAASLLALPGPFLVCPVLCTGQSITIVTDLSGHCSFMRGGEVILNEKINGTLPDMHQHNDVFLCDVDKPGQAERCNYNESETDELSNAEIQAEVNEYNDLKDEATSSCLSETAVTLEDKNITTQTIVSNCDALSHSFVFTEENNESVPKMQLKKRKRKRKHNKRLKRKKRRLLNMLQNGDDNTSCSPERNELMFKSICSEFFYKDSPVLDAVSTDCTLKNKYEEKLASFSSSTPATPKVTVHYGNIFKREKCGIVPFEGHKTVFDEVTDSDWPHATVNESYHSNVNDTHERNSSNNIENNLVNEINDNVNEINLNNSASNEFERHRSSSLENNLVNEINDNVNEINFNNSASDECERHRSSNLDFSQPIKSGKETDFQQLIDFQHCPSVPVLRYQRKKVDMKNSLNRDILDYETDEERTSSQFSKYHVNERFPFRSPPSPRPFSAVSDEVREQHHSLSCIEFSTFPLVYTRKRFLNDKNANVSRPAAPKGKLTDFPSLQHHSHLSSRNESPIYESYENSLSHENSTQLFSEPALSDVKENVTNCNYNPKGLSSVTKISDSNSSKLSNSKFSKKSKKIHSIGSVLQLLRSRNVNETASDLIDGSNSKHDIGSWVSSYGEIKPTICDEENCDNRAHSPASTLVPASTDNHKSMEGSVVDRERLNTVLRNIVSSVSISCCSSPKIRRLPLPPAFHELSLDSLPVLRDLPRVNDIILFYEERHTNKTVEEIQHSFEFEINYINSSQKRSESGCVPLSNDETVVLVPVIGRVDDVTSDGRVTLTLTDDTVDEKFPLIDIAESSGDGAVKIVQWRSISCPRLIFP